MISYKTLFLHYRCRFCSEVNKHNIYVYRILHTHRIICIHILEWLYNAKVKRKKGIFRLSLSSSRGKYCNIEKHGNVTIFIIVSCAHPWYKKHLFIILIHFFPFHCHSHLYYMLVCARHAFGDNGGESWISWKLEGIVWGYSIGFGTFMFSLIFEW